MYNEDKFETKEFEKEIKFKFGKWFKNKRTELNISQKYVAEVAGIKNDYISRVEKGYVNPSLIYCAKMVNALGYEICYKPKKMDDQK